MNLNKELTIKYQPQKKKCGKDMCFSAEECSSDKNGITGVARGKLQAGGGNWILH